MTALYIARLMSDLALYFAFFAFAFSFGKLTVNVMLMFVIAAAVGAVCCLLEKAPAILRLLPLLALVLCFRGAGTIWDWILPVPACLYVVIQAIRNKWVTSYSSVKGNFKPFIVLYFVLLFISLVAGKFSNAETYSVPFVIIWLVLSVYLMRVLRLVGSATLSRKFKLVNTAMLGGIGVVAVILSSPVMLNFFKKVFHLVYNYTFKPLIILFGYAVSGLVWLIEKLTWFFDVESGINEEGKENIILTGTKDLFDLETVETLDLTNMFIGFGIFIAAIVIILIMKRLLHNEENVTQNELKFSREKITTESTGKRRFNPFYRSTNREKVRDYYKRYLQRCQKLNIPIEGFYPSQAILNMSGEVMSKQAAGKLRDTWLPARYSELEEVSDDDVKTAKDAFRALEK